VWLQSNGMFMLYKAVEEDRWKSLKEILSRLFTTARAVRQRVNAHTRLSKLKQERIFK
jgi:hypothetical protein